MIPGMNPRQMQQAMKRMGIKQIDFEAIEVIIRTPEKEIVISDPSIQKVNMMGNWSYQISGEETERSLNTTPEINEEDIKTVMQQANCTEEQAKQAIEESKGDLAEAIMKLSE
ncbi:nascent polypeptide-associated complex protein [Candidatus Woesearchaeota archaeon]|nr:nascent polypeptide-associated complex protein [Candidatus Woesearchaeota archaeon]MCF8012952.1 nascent polypeptide-associated complex protein [Candidatus Woesearchaeota archaeon]